jgi:hypothetical protein
MNAGGIKDIPVSPHQSEAGISTINYRKSRKSSPD